MQEEAKAFRKTYQLKNSPEKHVDQRGEGIAKVEEEGEEGGLQPPRGARWQSQLGTLAALCCQESSFLPRIHAGRYATPLTGSALDTDCMLLTKS
eukprot:7042008-Pyramimonas_sp.AAC.1